MASTQIFFDDFGDGTPLPTLAGNGSVTESGGDTIVTITGGQNADWWTFGRNGVLAYKLINDFRTDEKIIRFESEHSAIVPDPATAQSHTMWGLHTDDGNFVYFGYDGTNTWAGWTSGFAGWSASGALAVSTPYKMQLLWDIEAQNVLFLVETAPGSWTQLYSLNISHNFQRVFYYAKNYGAFPAIQGQWSYLDVYSVTPDAVLADVTGMLDVATVPGMGGDLRWDDPDAAAGTGYNLPGSSERQGASDVATVPDVGGSPAWWDSDTIGTAYANLRIGTRETRRRASDGSWDVELAAATNLGPHAIQQASDGTLFLLYRNFVTVDEIWEKPLGGSWSYLTSHPFTSMLTMSVASGDELWTGGANWVSRWRRSTGWTTWFMQSELSVLAFTDPVVWAYGVDDVIAVGSTNGHTLVIGHWDGVSWSVRKSYAAGAQPTAIWADGDDVWIANGLSPPTVMLNHIASQGAGAITNITDSWFSGSAFDKCSINGIWGTAVNLWVSIENDQGDPDVAHSVDNGSNWNNYIRNPGLGCTSVYGDTQGNVFTGHLGASTVSVWRGTGWTTENLGGGTFVGWTVSPSGGDQGYQRLLVPYVAATIFGVGQGQLLDLPGQGIPDQVTQTEGYAQYSAEQATTDSEAHPHFIGRRPYRLFYYDAAADAWSNPVSTGFTGYARDGTRYTGGVQDAGPVYAPWYSEVAGTDRSSVGSFPAKALISVTRSEVVIFDFVNYPTDLDVWMRFRIGDGGTFKLVGRIDESLTDVCMSNGVLCLVSQWNGIENGGLFLIDFRQNDQRFLNLIRADNHWFGVGGRDITDRDLGGNFTTAGVSPSLRLDPEYLGSVSAYSLTDGSKTWVAVGGEDPGPDVFEVDASGVPQIRATPTGDGIGGYDLSSRRQVLFDRDGWLWHTVGGRLYRNGLDYQEGAIQAKLSRDDRYPYVDLGIDIVDLVDSENFVYAATARGVYRISRGSLEYRLMWTIAGGGGVGLAGTPGAGEILVGDDPEIEQVRAFTVNGSGYIGVAVKLDAGLSGGVTLIRTSDDAVIDSMQVPLLAEDGSYVIHPVGL